jgi:hypothetical protein
MIETEYRLQESRSATCDANGTVAITQVGPVRAGERWRIRRFSVSTTSGGTFTVFRGNDVSSPSNQLDYTERAEGDTSETDISLMPGETISFLWDDCDASAVGTVRFEGDRFVPGRRAY